MRYLFRGLALVFLLAAAIAAQTTVTDTVYQSPGQPFIGTLSAQSANGGSSVNATFSSTGLITVGLLPGSYTVQYLQAGSSVCVETWRIPQSRTALSISQVRGFRPTCGNFSDASEPLPAWAATISTGGTDGGSGNAVAINGVNVQSFSGLAKFSSGIIGPATSTDIAAAFSGTGAYLRKDGTTDNGPTGGGATLPNTTSIFKGNNSGGAVAAVAGTDYLAPSSSLAAANLTGTVPSSSLPVAGGTLGSVKSSACPAGNHANGAYNVDGTPVCTADSGASYTQGQGISISSNTIALVAPTASALGGVKSGAAPGGSHVSGVDTSGNLIYTTDTGGSATVPSGNGASARPTVSAGSTGLYLDTSRNVGDQFCYFNGGAYYCPGAYDSTLTRDPATGALGVNPIAVPLLSASGRQTFTGPVEFSRVILDSCYLSDNVTPCPSTSSSNTPVQNNAVALGNMSTLNLGAGLNGAISGGTVTLTNTGVTHVNGLAGDITMLPDLVEDASWGLTYTSHNSTQTEIFFNNTNASTGGIHNFYFGMGGGGDFNITDNTVGQLVIDATQDRTLVRALWLIAGPNPQPACNSGARGYIFYQNNGTSDDHIQACMYQGGAYSWLNVK